jgi:flagellar protein FliS
MGAHHYQAYLESQVFSASPLQLVHMLYRGALEAVRAARRDLSAGAIASRSQQITKAWNILAELALSTDRERGGGVARNLVELYTYMQRLLMDANCRQADEPLAETERLLATLEAAWAACAENESFQSSASGDTVRDELALTCI